MKRVKLIQPILASHQMLLDHLMKVLLRKIRKSKIHFSNLKLFLYSACRLYSKSQIKHLL